MGRKKKFDGDLHIKVIKDDMELAAIYAKSKGKTVSIYVRDLLKRLAKKGAKWTTKNAKYNYYKYCHQ